MTTGLTLELPALVTIGDDLRVQESTFATFALPALVSVGNVFNLQTSSLGSVALPALADVGGDVYIADNDDLVTLALPSLAAIGGQLDLQYHDDLESLALPSLVGDEALAVDVSGNPVLATVDLSGLEQAVEIRMINNELLAAVDLGALIGHDALDFLVSGHPALTTFTLGSLVRAGDITFTNNPVLSTCGLYTVLEQLEAMGTVTLQSNLEDGAACVCGPGADYVIGTGCVDIDECALGLDECEPTAVCDDLPGGYQCLCAEGTLDVNGDASECVPIDQIAAGYQHTCAIVETGALYCWGFNDTGKLGDGTQTQRPSPTRIGAAIGDGAWTKVSTAWNHTCGITTGGALYCWGNNLDGQIGRGNDDPAFPFRSPTQVGADIDWVEVTTGSKQTCGLRQSGPFKTLWCWGNLLTDASDVNGVFTRTFTPVQVGTGSNWVSLSAGGTHACGLRGLGELWCWGLNAVGQLGTGQPQNLGSVDPVRVASDRTWTSVDAGESHTCGITDEHMLYCWGAGWAGQLAQLDFDNRQYPTMVGPFISWQSVDAAYQNTCGVTTEGHLYCWGQNDYGQLGDGTNIDRNNITRVGAGVDWTAVAVGAEHACGLAAGAAKCWGSNDYGQLGDGDTTNRLVPALVSGPTWSAVDAGTFHNCAVKDGDIWCWGNNAGGPLGDGTTTMRTTPVALVEPDLSIVWTSVSGGRDHSCAITSESSLYCWGSDFYGQVGDGGFGGSVTPKPVTHVGVETGWSVVSTGTQHTCGIKDGALHCWGRNDNGRLGDGTVTLQTAPVQIGTSSGWTDVSAGDAHTCGIDAGDLYCWGLNSSGQLGDGSSTQSLVPVPIGTTLEWSSVVAGYYHTCAITVDEDLYCWGLNIDGQLGDTTTTASSTPVAIAADASWTKVAVHFGHTCALRDDGALFCWGGNTGGKLGIGTEERALAPTRVGLDTTWTEVTLGDGHTCGLRAGALLCWGRNHPNHVLGLGDTRTPHPVQF